MATAKGKNIESQMIEVPELNVRRLKVRVVGTSPLVLHAWSAKSKRQMEETQAGKPRQGRKNREPRDPQGDYEGAMYLCPDGRPGVPARLFKAAMVTASNDVGLFKTVMKRAFFVEGDVLLLEGDEPKMNESFVRLESGVADLRYRPQWTHWSVELTIQYNASIISAAHLVNLLRTAGFGCGIGEGRASSPRGTGMGWGAFEVVGVEGD
jgi:hypothetical protein